MNPGYTFRYRPAWPVIHQPAGYAVSLSTIIGIDDTLTFWGTLEHIDGNEFEFTREGTDKKGRFSLPDDRASEYTKAINDGYIFELTISDKGGTVKGFSPRLKQLVDEAYDLQFALGQAYIQAKYHDGPGNVAKLERAWDKARKRHKRRYSGYSKKAA